MAAHLKQQHGQAWVVGGTQLQSAFIEKKLLDSLEIYEMPVFLGDGIALFPASKHPPYALQAMSAELIAEKVIKKVYYF
ncbi:dihydrofolate reductase family protein [Acinetobacter pullicarnis]|uniref:dihydrofolate reductase family protein n=1 Tax=Acinetobacter pullicarnis TaxID=2576829 RepID=UPI001122AD08|nr:dihydrofolate reductase family protein [Acinetobacter pullicarnis]